jgi:hypothetical protein
MSAFGGLILTNRGKNLQSKAQTGITLQYTRIAMGDGSLGSTPILDLNALRSEKKSLDISKLNVLSGGRAVVGGVLSNQDMTEGFYFREIGVFAEDPDLGEVLYCYANCGELAEYIPPGGGSDLIEKSIDIQTLVGNAANVSAVINSSLIYASAEDLNDHVNNSDVHVTTLEKQKWNQTSTDLETLDGTVAVHLAEYMPHDSGLNQYASAVDGNGIYTVVDFKREDGSLYLKSTASNADVNGNYQTVNWKFYENDGVTLGLEGNWTIAYNEDGFPVSKVWAVV